MTKDTSLLIYNEPTPYILALVRSLVAGGANITLVFLEENASQHWMISHDDFPCETVILPQHPAEARRRINTFLESAPRRLHTGGWGPAIMRFAIVQAHRKGLPVFVETDTPPHPSPFWKALIKNMAYPALFRRVRLFFPAGSAQMKYLSQYKVPSTRMVKACMTVDVAAIQGRRSSDGISIRADIRARHKIPEDAPVFIFVGRLAPEKGIETMLEAFRTMDGPQQQAAHLVIIGDGPLRNSVSHAVDSCERIHSPGRLTNNEVWDYLIAADILLLFSLREPWGLVVNEAMAAGCTAIVSRLAGCCNDLIIDGETGVTVDPENLTDCVEAMTSMLNAPDTAQRLAGAAFDNISHWTIDNEADIIRRGWNET